MIKMIAVAVAVPKAARITTTETNGEVAAAASEIARIMTTETNEVEIVVTKTVRIGTEETSRALAGAVVRGIAHLPV